MKASESLYSKIDWLPTGFSNLDRIMGGGIPSRKITEISGVYSVGKSTLALMIVAKAQQAGMACLWADSELSYTTDYADSLGVDSDKLDLIQEKLAEDILDGIEEWADSHKNALIVLDSVGELLTRAEAEKNSGEKVIGAQAKLIATFSRKIKPMLTFNNVTLIVLNHQFTDLMSGKIMTGGGRKLEHAKAIWLSLRKASKRVMQGETQVGEIIEAEIKKHKLAATYKQSCELQMIYGSGFNAENDLAEDALAKGVLEKKGNSYFFEGIKIAVGQSKLREAFKDQSFAEKIKLCLNK